DKPSSDTSCETLDTFACPAPKNRPHSPSSAHTYRLLVFKEQLHKNRFAYLLAFLRAVIQREANYDWRKTHRSTPFSKLFSGDD
ncbi:hypothetical protein, partial [Caballeronia sp. AZ10_KS36]|uniref:hypothetical protein n=1 Tax=Caballeronia sp. AZ10_KS36 TaxID=2921757 RepID=UPI002028E17C